MGPHRSPLLKGKRSPADYACTSKVRYRTRKAAKKVAFGLQRRLGGLIQCVYECPLCNGFHLSKTSTAGRGRLLPRSPKYQDPSHDHSSPSDQ